MLVQDLTSTSTAASMSVSVGASSDPHGQMCGVAHFCEHMCFLGSAAYPVENHYKKTLALHNGHSNASTSMERTVFKFDVDAGAFETLFDIFHNFFISPTFSADGTKREVNAVDSENSKNLTSDDRRRLQILKALAVSTPSRYLNFSTGNTATLVPSADSTPPGVDPIDVTRRSLLYFHSLHYTSDRMACCIVGPQSLDELAAISIPRLERIPVRHPLKSSTDDGSTLPPPPIKAAFDDAFAVVPRLESSRDAAVAAPSAASAGGASPSLPPPAVAFISSFPTPFPFVLTVNPLRTQRVLALLFPAPPSRHLKDRSPSRLVSHILGHEGAGSAFASLQDLGLATALGTGSRMSDGNQTLFEVELTLTQEGEDRWQDVVRILFDHIELLRTTAETNPERLAQQWGEV